MTILPADSGSCAAEWGDVRQWPARLLRRPGHCRARRHAGAGGGEGRVVRRTQRPDLHVPRAGAQGAVAARRAGGRRRHRGSLYFSESGNLWAPCRFCWFQRIFMYSLAVVLVVAAVRRDRSIRWYAGALALIGMLISIWHMLLERGVVSESSECALTIPCATPYYISFGDHRDPTTLGPADWYGITLAVMAFAAFVFILVVLFLPEPLDDALDTPDSLDQLEDHDGQPAAG
ncbi:MAG: disulfide bond formation protein B [Ilumatobacteraceae bacterium]